jgi:hypothetical protein
LGPIGQTLFEDLSSKGYDCIGYDKNQGKFKHSLNSFDVIIGATGDSIVQQKHIPELKRGCHLISVSSSDREFPAPYLRSHANTGSVIHETFWNKEYDVYLANGGFPITFKGKRYESTPIEIEKTIALLYGSALYASTSDIKDSGFVDVPEMVTDVIEKQ